jgi:hypothetical protein
MNSSVSLMLPCLSSLNTYSAVISLARLAGKIIWSAPRSNSTPPYSASTRIACGALIGGSSFLGASFFCASPEAGLCAGAGAASAAAHRLATKAAAVSKRPIR